MKDTVIREARDDEHRRLEECRSVRLLKSEIHQHFGKLGVAPHFHLEAAISANRAPDGMQP